MRRVFTITLFAAVLTAPLYAQIRGIPPSVSSIGSSSTPMTPGIGASVTSLGPAGLVDRVGSMTSISVPVGHHPVRNIVPFFWPAIYQPQPQPVIVVQPQPPVVVVVERDRDDDTDDRREPLVLEWKGDKYVRVSGGEQSDGEGTAEGADRKQDRNSAKKSSRKPAPRPTEPLADSKQRDRVTEPETPATVLVFLDGRRQDVKNYAIVAEFFYDLSDRLPRKILLADLDLNATIAANEERGVEFRLPTASSPNQVITRP